MMRDRRYGGDVKGYGGDSRGYRGNGRFRSPTPPRRLSPPSGRFRNRGGRSPRRTRYDGPVEEERRVGGSLRRDHDRRGDRGTRDYGDRANRDYDRRSYGRGDKRSSRECDVNFSRGDRGNDRVYDRDFIHVDRGIDREHDRNFSRGDEGDRGNDRGHVRNFSTGDRNNDGNSSRGGERISNYGFVDRGRDYGDRERDCDDGHLRSTYQSGGSGEYSWRMHGASERTSSKFQWDHLLDESRNGIQSSIRRGVGSSGLRSDLNYDYQSNKFFDKGRNGLVVDGNPVLVEPERGSDYASSSYPMNVSFPTKTFSHVDAIGSASRNSSSGLRKDEDFHFHDKVHVEKLVSGGPVMRNPLDTESYKDKSLRYSSTDTDYTLSLSWPKGCDPVHHSSFKEDMSSSLRDDLSLPSDSIRLSSGMMTNSTGYDGVGENSQIRSPMNREGRFGDPKSYSQSYLATAGDNLRDYNYSQVDIEEAGKFPGFTETYRNSLGVGEEYNLKDTSRLGDLDLIGDKVDVSSHQGYLRGSRLLDNHSISFGLSISNRDDAHLSFHARRKDVECRDPQPKYKRKFYNGPGSSLLREHNHDDEVVGTPRFHHGQPDVLPSRKYDPHIGDVDGNSDEKLMMGNVSLSEPTSHGLKRNHAEKQFGDDRNINYVPRDAGELWNNDGDSIISSKSLGVSNSKYGKSRRSLNMVGHHQSPFSSNLFPSSGHLRKSHVSGPRDIKKRLGPVSQKVHVSQRLVKKYKPSLKKRLGPGPKKSHVTLPWLKNLNAPSLPRIQDEPGRSAHLQGEDSPEGNVTPAKPEPPENSQDFKQLVKIAFFKFVKQLNETPAKRRKYKEQGIACSLKCIICRRSEEFLSTESLAAHAFTCQMLGLRSQHLGFHKALCALMGWKFAEQSNNTWSCEKLSDVENMALKEDLILWPPVVIIHNSTIGNKNPDQQVIVTIEELEAKLSDMGFGDKAKVHRGKPANLSIMVVAFAGTLSGLLEAERLHKFFADKNHGRAEFLKVKSSCNQNHGTETESASPNNFDSILYGYSGIAEDLDKLDFDAKKRRLVKSKKEIEHIAEAPIKT